MSTIFKSHEFQADQLRSIAQSGKRFLFFPVSVMRQMRKPISVRLAEKSDHCCASSAGIFQLEIETEQITLDQYVESCWADDGNFPPKTIVTLSSGQNVDWAAIKNRADCANLLNAIPGESPVATVRPVK